ncbi:pectinesterase family protein [Candidatus Neomarinimicrobiota bacterium]
MFLKMQSPFSRCNVLDTLIRFVYPVVFFSILAVRLYGIEPDLIVSANEAADYPTIQVALNSIPLKNTERILILIRAGVYREKVFIDRNNVTLIGEGPEQTHIEYPILRRQWREDNPDDWGAAVVNIKASDVVIQNLTVENIYGKIYDDHDHQFAVRLMEGTRIIFDNCHFLSGGGDTVSLWDKESGMYYHRNCYFQGYVDFVCPRGWCYITDSRFYQSGKTATLWHEGSKYEDQKLVITNSSFDGVQGFKLGRRHYNAQFNFVDCKFSTNMADAPIYRVTYPDNPEKDRPNNWGDRYYFYNAKREDGDYDWHADNIPAPTDDQYTAAWAFVGKWDPELTEDLEPIAYNIDGDKLTLDFDEMVTVKGRPHLVFDGGRHCIYQTGTGSESLNFILHTTGSAPGGINGNNAIDGIILASGATLDNRYFNSARIEGNQGLKYFEVASH